jgi:arylsulfatase A-like enzyme
MDEDPPNLLIVHPHNMGRYLGCYGRPVETPNVDALAAGGRRFTNAFCTAPHCSPARGSLWTGTHPHRNGLVGLAHLGWSLDDRPTLFDLLGEEGYDTRLIGLQHVAEDPRDAGFDHVDGSTHGFEVDEPAADVAERTADFLESGAARDGPWVCSAGFSEVHRQPEVERCLDCGWTFDLPGYDRGDPAAVDLSGVPWLPDEPGVREDVAGFHGMVRAVDDAVGTIVDALAETGLDEETLVVFTTDHGIGFPRAMGTLYDPGVETFLILDGPGVEPGVDDRLFSGVDLLPTLLDLVGVAPPADVDGRSFAPLVTDGDAAGTTDTPRDRVFLEFTWHSKYVPMRGVRTNRYKYVRSYGDQPGVYIPAPLFTAPAGLAVREEYYSFQRPAEELYDLHEDPLEEENLVPEVEGSDGDSTDDGEHAEALERLRGAVDDWMARTDDRLLEGPWPPTPEQEERVWKSPWIPERVGH